MCSKLIPEVSLRGCGDHNFITNLPCNIKIDVRMARNKPRTAENVEFLISIGEFKLRLSLPKNTTVGGLIAVVRGYQALHEQYGPQGSAFLGLGSTHTAPLLDYWLAHSFLDFSRFRRQRLELKCLYACERRGERLSAGQFQFLVCLGTGACGEVFLVRSRVSGAVLALKRVSKARIKNYQQLMALFRQRKNLMRMGNNPHTSNLHACFQSKDHFNFLMDYYPGGELYLHLSSQRIKLTPVQVRYYFCEILLAMEYIHKRKVLYRDLKPENIFVDFNGHLRIGDFGLSKCDFEEDDFTTSICGSPQYMAPEIIDNQNYNFAADFYSIGAILYQLLTGVPPYYDHSELEEAERLILMKSMTVDLTKATSDPHLQSLLANLLHPDPDLRISNFQQIKNSPWLAGVDWKIIELKQDIMPFAPDPSAPTETYIGKEFLALSDKVNQINFNCEDEPFSSEISQTFEYLRPQSKKLLGLQEIHLLVKPKCKGSMKDKKQKLPKKANLSVALFQREETVCQSVCSEPRSIKTVKGENKENLCFVHPERSKKMLVNLTKQGSTIFLGKTGQKMQVAGNRHKTQRGLLTPASQCSSEGGSRDLISKGTSRGRDLVRGQSRQCKSKGRSKQKTLKQSSLNKNGPMKRKEQRKVLPTCSFKIKLG